MQWSSHSCVLDFVVIVVCFLISSPVPITALGKLLEQLRFLLVVMVRKTGLQMWPAQGYLHQQLKVGLDLEHKTFLWAF